MFKQMMVENVVGYHSTTSGPGHGKCKLVFPLDIKVGLIFSQPKLVTKMSNMIKIGQGLCSKAAR